MTNKTHTPTPWETTINVHGAMFVQGGPILKNRIGTEYKRLICDAVFDDKAKEDYIHIVKAVNECEALKIDNERLIDEAGDLEQEIFTFAKTNYELIKLLDEVHAECQVYLSINFPDLTKRLRASLSKEN